MPRPGAGYGRALHTVEDFRRCAFDASPHVYFVKVRAAVNDQRMKPGVVELRVRGWGIGPFRVRLPKDEYGKVKAAIVAETPVGVELKWV